MCGNCDGTSLPVEGDQFYKLQSDL